jgi:hypothetical protein
VTKESGGKSDKKSMKQTPNQTDKADLSQKQGGASATRAMTAHQKMNMSSFTKTAFAKKTFAVLNTEDAPFAE